MDTLFLMTKGIENQATLIFPVTQRCGAGFLFILYVSRFLYSTKE